MSSLLVSNLFLQQAPVAVLLAVALQLLLEVLDSQPLAQCVGFALWFSSETMPPFLLFYSSPYQVH